MTWRPSWQAASVAATPPRPPPTTRTSAWSSGAPVSRVWSACGLDLVVALPAGFGVLEPRDLGSGLRGVRALGDGGAEVSPMHGNYFVNAQNATAADVRGLIERVQQAVSDRFGIHLEPEVKIIGAWGEYLNQRGG